MEKNQNNVDFDDFVSKNNVETSKAPSNSNQSKQKWILLSCAFVLLSSSISTYLGYNSRKTELENKALTDFVYTQLKNNSYKIIQTTFPYSTSDPNKIDLYQLKITYQEHQKITDIKTIRTEFLKNEKGGDVYHIHIPDGPLSLTSEQIFNIINNSDLHKKINKNDVSKNIDFFNHLFNTSNPSSAIKE